VLYGIERLQEAVRRNGSLDPEALTQTLLDGVSDFRDLTPADDDVTVMVISRP
jgi:serine phosphatase RsbU (regulator of sigma subunit)